MTVARTWRRIAVLAIALATLAAIPVLLAPWDEDEAFLVGAARGSSPWMNRPLDAYRFSSGDPVEVAARISDGRFAWYTAPDFKYALFRPLTSAALRLDVALFGDRRLGYQIHSLAWHGALIVVAALILRRALPGRVGQGALLLFALSAVHTTPTGWISARHVLVGTVPALLGLAAHRRWREDGWRLGVPFALVGYASALLGSEAGAQALAYVVAYETCRAELPLRRRVAGLLPLFGVVFAYVALYRILDRGHAYGDALTSLPAFVVGGLPRLVVHACVLLGASVRPDNAWGYDALRASMIVVVPLVALAPAAIRGLPAAERRGATWLSLGALLSLVPVVGAPLESRVLVAPSLGASVVVAAVLTLGVARLRDRSRAASRALVIVGAASVAAVHVVFAPLELPLHYAAMARERDRRFGAFLRATHPEVEGRDLFVVGAPHFLFGQLGGYLREGATGVRPRHWVAVADANCAHRLERTVADRLVVVPLCPPGFFPYGRLEKGDEVKQLDWTVRVLESAPANRFEIVFAAPLESLALDVVTFDGFSDRRVPLPAVGSAITLPQPAPPELYALDAPTRWLHARFDP